MSPASRSLFVLVLLQFLRSSSGDDVKATDDGLDDDWNNDDDGNVTFTFPPTAPPQGTSPTAAPIVSTPTPGVDPASVGVDVACTAEGYYPLYCTRNDALLNHGTATIDAEKYAGAFMPRERGDEDDVFLGTYPDDGEAETCPCNFNTSGETLKPTPAPNCDDDVLCGGPWTPIFWNEPTTAPKGKPTKAAASPLAVLGGAVVLVGVVLSVVIFRKTIRSVFKVPGHSKSSQDRASSFDDPKDDVEPSNLNDLPGVSG